MLWKCKVNNAIYWTNQILIYPVDSIIHLSNKVRLRSQFSLSLHVGQKYAQIFVCGHYLFRGVNSFPRAQGKLTFWGKLFREALSSFLFRTLTYKDKQIWMTATSRFQNLLLVFTFNMKILISRHNKKITEKLILRDYEILWKTYTAQRELQILLSEKLSN